MPPVEGEFKQNSGEFIPSQPPQNIEGQSPQESPQEFRLPEEFSGEQMPNEQFQQAEPMPQTMPPAEQQPQMEIAPPPPPPAESAPAPAPEPPPSSFLNNQYLGAFVRFLLGN